jgi:hypothetical protein
MSDVDMIAAASTNKSVSALSVVGSLSSLPVVQAETDRVAGVLRVAVKVKKEALTPASAPASLTRSPVVSAPARSGPYVATRWPRVRRGSMVSASTLCRSETRFGLRGLGILVHQTSEDLAAADPSDVEVDDW